MGQSGRGAGGAYAQAMESDAETRPKLRKLNTVVTFRTIMKAPLSGERILTQGIHSHAVHCHCSGNPVPSILMHICLA
jgi:hypothetical protein